MDNDEKLIKHDLTVWVTIVIVYNFVNSNLKDKSPFDLDWFYFSIASLFGLIIHSLFTSKLTLLIIKKFNIKDYNIKLSIVEFIKWSTIYIVNNILFTYLKNKKVTFNKEWIKLYGGIILGYILFNLLIGKAILKLSENNTNIMTDTFKTMIGIFLGYYLSHGHVHIDFYRAFFSIQISLILYYIIINKNIPSLLI
jgi:hypothetical protein